MELRLYSFVNFYLSQIQQGIQTGHAAVQLIRTYTDKKQKHHELVMDWADNHKTFIVLNGGHNAALEQTLEIVQRSGYPYSAFFEDGPSLGGLMTTVAVVLPENVFNARRFDPTSQIETYYWADPDGGSSEFFYPSSLEHELIKLIRSSRLA